MSENTVNGGLRRLGWSGSEMTGHGFRSMASTLLNEQGWNRDAIERQLAHSERTSIRAAYNYAEHLPERRRMMRAWSDRKDVATFAGQWLQRAQDGHRLHRQRHDVLAFHLHALRRDAPLACI